MDVNKPMVFTDAVVPLPKREIAAAKSAARREAADPRRQEAPRELTLVAAPCVNCGRSFRGKRSDTPFCGLQCKGEAKAVRYARGKHREYPSGPPEDIKEAMRMKVAHALGGGYDSAARRLTQETRDVIIERDGGLCVLCGQAGTEIDHIEGPSSDLSNLRLLCRDCHLTVTHAHFIPVTDEATKGRRDWLLTRITVPEPLLACDGEAWSSAWRQWTKDNGTWQEL